MASPINTVVNVNIIPLPVATADTSLATENCPIIIKSTAPYRFWRNKANNTGNANLTRGPSIFPSVNTVTVLLLIIQPPKF